MSQNNRSSSLQSPQLNSELKQKLDQLQPVQPGLLVAKLLGVHALSTLLTLSVCPQFGFDGLKSFFDLSDVLMRFGHLACQAMCGLIYLAVSVAVASLVVRKEELFFLRRKRLLYVISLLFISLSFFAMVTPWELEVSVVMAWIIGAFAGGLISQAITFRWLQFGTAFK